MSGGGTASGTQHAAKRESERSAERTVQVTVVIPPNLRILAQSGREIALQVREPVTQRAVLDALEAAYPVLRGTIRDHITQRRRAFLRFFACAQDLSHEPPDAPLPDPVARGIEPFLIVGAIAGG